MEVQKYVFGINGLINRKCSAPDSRRVHDISQSTFEYTETLKAVARVNFFWSLKYELARKLSAAIRFRRTHLMRRKAALALDGAARHILTIPIRLPSWLLSNVDPAWAGVGLKLSL